MLWGVLRHAAREAQAQLAEEYSAQVAETRALTVRLAASQVGLGHIVASYYRSFTSYHIH